jgi:hypothetical protein
VWNRLIDVSSPKRRIKKKEREKKERERESRRGGKKKRNFSFFFAHFFPLSLSNKQTQPKNYPASKQDMTNMNKWTRMTPK